MKARYAALLVLLLTATAALGAGDFWLEKAYTEWTAEQTRKLLTDSPWTRQVEVMSKSATTGRGALPDNTRPTGAGAGGGAGGDSAAASATEQFHTYTVRWLSSLILRQAAVRTRMLEGVLSAEQAEQVLQQRPPEYIVHVLGRTMAEFEGIPTEELQAKAYLKIEKKKIAPGRVNLVRGRNGRLQSVEFYFPREVDGQPVIGADAKSVEFSCAAKKYNVRTKFDLKKMRVGGELQI